MSLCPFRRVDDRSLHVRVFVPGAGVPEDPGTGSAAGPIALLARRLWGTDVDVVIRQGDETGRPCRIDAHGEERAIRVGGRVIACAEGSFVGVSRRRRSCCRALTKLSDSRASSRVHS